MFEKEIYIKRRNLLKKKLKSGVVLINGNPNEPINFKSNTYRFRQDSTFLYYFGIDMPDLIAVIDIDEDKEIIFGNEPTQEDLIWEKFNKTIYDLAIESGVSYIRRKTDLKNYIKNRKVRFLPQYRCSNTILISELIDVNYRILNSIADIELIRAVIEQRLKKDKMEINEIIKAIKISKAMVDIVFEHIKDGIKESEILSKVESYAIENETWISFATILTKEGAILHNTKHSNILKKGDLVIFDSGVESKEHYTSDITRTIPVGRASQLQIDIYDIVSSAQIEALKTLKEGTKFIKAHMKAAETISTGLKNLGFLKGSIEAIVESGAYTLFFPHGIGHPIGLDVHDLDSLGEDYVGYDDYTKRSDKFGFKYLRFAKEVRDGYTMTLEPGIYFIPTLIKLWYKERKFEDLIDYNKVLKAIDFGGVRIEDDILIRKNDCLLLSKNIRKEIN